MQNWSIRWMLFMMALTMFWMFVPLLIVSRFTGPLGLPGFLVAMAFVWYGMPKVNKWLIVNTPFGNVWRWARENEETP